MRGTKTYREGREDSEPRKNGNATSPPLVLKRRMRRAHSLAPPMKLVPTITETMKMLKKCGV